MKLVENTMPRTSGKSNTVYTPAVTRFRARVKEDETPPCPAVKTSPKLAPTDSQVVNMNMQEVLEHLEMLQTRTETNLAASIETAVEKSKKEINENIESLSQSIHSIRSDLSSFEQKYNEKFVTIEAKIKESGKKADLACSEVKRVEQIIRSGNKSTSDKLKYIKEDSTALKKSTEKELASLRSELSRSKREHQAALEKHNQEFLQWKGNSNKVWTILRLDPLGTLTCFNNIPH